MEDISIMFKLREVEKELRVFALDNAQDEGLISYKVQALDEIYKKLNNLTQSSFGYRGFYRCLSELNVYGYPFDMDDDDYQN